MRSLLLLVPILLGLMGGGTTRFIGRSVSRETVIGPSVRVRPPAQVSCPEAVKPAPGPAKLNEHYEMVLGDLPDIDALLALEPPALDASTAEWVEFGRSLKKIDHGKRYSFYGITTPTLPWYALMAEHQPQAVYQLYDERTILARKFRHLIEYGLLPDWHEAIRDVDQLILDGGSPLLAIAVADGIEVARRRFADAFWKAEGRNALNFDSLRFSLASMSASELDRVIPRLQSGVFSIRPRELRRLMLSGHFDDADSEILALIDASELRKSRSMASYFLHGAELGNADYVKLMIADLHDNAGQPTNFYCAPCALALVSDGLLGSELMKAAAKGRPIRIDQEDFGFALSTHLDSLEPQGE